MAPDPQAIAAQIVNQCMFGSREKWVEAIASALTQQQTEAQNTLAERDAEWTRLSAQYDRLLAEKRAAEARLAALEAERDKATRTVLYSCDRCAFESWVTASHSYAQAGRSRLCPQTNCGGDQRPAPVPPSPVAPLLALEQHEHDDDPTRSAESI